VTTWADRVVLLFTLILLPTLYASLWHDAGAGESLRIITASGEETLPLNQGNQELSIDGPLGTSVISIENGQARFIHSPCRGKQCIHSGWLARGGDFAACLPNRVSITVIGRDPSYDSLVF